ncbi:MAG: hypothetical protein QNK03_21090 [Myxococcota bacterium]|nr:hypothetical protein [Myxococcota bacterium]
MKVRGSLLSALVAFVLAAAAPAFADPELVASLEALAQEHLDAYDREDQNGTLRTIHSRSPHYRTTRELLAEQFPKQDLAVTLVHFHYIGHDDEFAYARLKAKAVAEDEGFADNVVDSVVLFHHENGAWKLWSEHIIGVELID